MLQHIQHVVIVRTCDLWRGPILFLLLFRELHIIVEFNWSLTIKLFSYSFIKCLHLGVDWWLGAIHPMIWWCQWEFKHLDTLYHKFIRIEIVYLTSIGTASIHITRCLWLILNNSRWLLPFVQSSYWVAWFDVATCYCSPSLLCIVINFRSRRIRLNVDWDCNCTIWLT